MNLHVVIWRSEDGEKEGKEELRLALALDTGGEDVACSFS